MMDPNDIRENVRVTGPDLEEGVIFAFIETSIGPCAILKHAGLEGDAVDVGFIVALDVLAGDDWTHYMAPLDVLAGDDWTHYMAPLEPESVPANPEPVGDLPDVVPGTEAATDPTPTADPPPAPEDVNLVAPGTGETASPAATGDAAGTPES